ncbi:MAG: hypothetical protein V1779_13915 [bacterium]
MLRSYAIFSTLLFAFSLNAQDWCNHKPAKFDKPLSFENKLISDRLNHTINPNILNYKETQIEIATMLKPEFFVDGRWRHIDTMSVYSIYNGYTIKHAFLKSFELQFSATDLIIKASEEIKNYSKESLNTNVSVGVKYIIYNSVKNNSCIGLFGQVTIPKFKNSLNTLFSPEVRVLVSRPFTKHTMLTGNLGGVYMNNEEKAEIVYALNIKRNIGKRFEMFAEFYKNCIKTGPARSPNKRWLLGFGYYFLSNLYAYSSIEGGWYHEDSLNDGQFDVGLTYRLK